jgi:hypothetical protein
VDRRFALTRLLNQRGFELPVLFALPIFRGGSRRGRFNAVIPKNRREKVFSDAIHRHGALPETSGFRTVCRGKRPKRDGRFNPLCFTSSSMRTGAFPNSERTEPRWLSRYGGRGHTVG